MSYSSSAPGLLPAKSASITRMKATKEHTTGRSRGRGRHITILAAAKKKERKVDDAAVECMPREAHIYTVNVRW